ncbi:MAG: bifunctional UDP-N-acetylglucosamine diphosphorylase/glucosamine-1-phosphate N-acetyltransferase GlmU [Wenzhouxiangellaceae bacterium]|nr:bifunctional UDP-N-acetylglucosamine diphosphorylase/glucosamine-1-phosphate N-acetyltransferase GlmU [Wenzhouxiangellaceae bacterium]MBS3746634.1 bifunctional UDP-N-acetylglucosamine diphosphorylase/glucosamine-1-phosphate N-acetyltransferase GlmU [Wenzhouxiangellaceae bacterium]MBS3823448.1 bifunctional UDP-N-acetylglucosamine diphosphorylase/glucosamine-1-phosphate N-acetyltransferase GlmU [Wenzhouxiangellaceae bacterium]
MKDKPLHLVVLAAGEGKRMNSGLPKVLQPLAGKPMLAHLLEAALALDPERVHVVIGHGADQVSAMLEALGDDRISTVLQLERLGTGHAVQQAMGDISASARVIVLPGDMPLVRSETLAAFARSPSALAVLSFRAPDPRGYGRILRDDQGRVVGIREQRDASEAEARITEVNSGVLAADADRLAEWLGRVDNDNAQGEYYLTDCIALAAADGAVVDAMCCGDPEETQGANNMRQLAELEDALQRRRRNALMDAGVRMPDPASVQIRARVTAGRDVVVESGAILEGEVRLGDGVVVSAGCVLRDSQLAAGTRLEPYCVLEGAETTGACTIGPFARLRPGTVLAAGVRIGNFVETKNAVFGEGAKANHLAYAGDARIGPRANLGAGTITCNYDGANKHRTTIGADAFIGSNSALVAPVTIGDRATVGAGSVISREAPPDALTVARARTRTVAGWERPVKKV